VQQLRAALDGLLALDDARQLAALLTVQGAAAH
jgi:hypothetical protein